MKHIERLTPRKIERGGKPVTLQDGSIIILPKQPKMRFEDQLAQTRRLMANKQFVAHLKKQNPLFVEMIKGNPYTLWFVLDQAYCLARGHYSHDQDNEPWWIELLETRVKIHLRNQYLIKDGTDPLCIVPYVTGHGVGYIIQDQGLPADAFHLFNLHRLIGIKQLAYLQDPGAKKSACMCQPNFPHTRLVHSDDVYMIGSLIVANNPCLRQWENVISTACLTHDTLTPAGGDTTKLACPALFDEDLEYHTLFQDPRREAYCEKYGIDVQLLIETVNGHGILGKVLDLADKAAYIARDAQMLMGYWGSIMEREMPILHREISLIMQGGDVCSLWASARVMDDNIVIMDTDRLEKFLQLRALLFKNLYYHPRARMLEYLVAKKIIKAMLERGHLTKDELMVWTDQQLETRIEEFCGFRPAWYPFEGVTLFECDSVQEAEFLAKMHQSERHLVLVDDFNAVTKTATNRFHVFKDRKIVTFEEARPEASQRIKDMIFMEKTVRMYQIPVSLLDMSEKHLKQFREYFDL